MWKTFDKEMSSAYPQEIALEQPLWYMQSVLRFLTTFDDSDIIFWLYSWTSMTWLATIIFYQIPPWKWPIKTETRKKTVIWLYIIVSNYPRSLTDLHAKCKSLRQRI